MHSLLTATFPHRHNADGSHVAICRRCFAMLASVRNEDELELYEVRHKCDRLTLYQSLLPAPEQGFLLQRLLMDKDLIAPRVASRQEIRRALSK
jgi:hypothetical protein